jgi:hypothetical protein
MINTLTARGNMFELAMKPISKSEFKELMKKGRNSDLYRELYEATTLENDLYGFQMVQGKPNLELYLNDSSLELKRTLGVEYEITYLPVDGFVQSIKGAESHYFVSETGFKSGHSELKFRGEFRKSELRFEVERSGLFNGTCSSIMSPTYKGQYLELVWNWSGYKKSYILSSKGKVFEITNPL